MSVNPDWHSESDARSPVRIRFYSREPLPVLKPGDLRLWVSPDNRRYRLYRGAFKWNVSRVRRAHQRWTAAGNIEEPGKAARFMLEISDVKLRSPFMALELGKDIRLVERAHAFAEAWDGQGNAVPVTLATAGDREKGFSYWQEWVGWGNTSPRMLEDVCWGAGMHGLVFRMRRAQPTLLEPCCEEAHEIWLGRLRRILDTDADGVCIRTLCHHNNVMDYMMMAFAPAVRERFRLEHGRDPEPGWNDAVLVRRLRGLAYTEFLRKAKQLAVKSGKKLALHFESGVEVPVSCDQRMQFNLEWEKWITEGIADELVLKLWFAGNPFIHERVLPLARRHDIPVYIVDRNSSLRNTPRAIERAGSLLRASRRAGFDGFAWYETCDYKRRNAQNVPEFRAHAGDAIRLSAAL